MDLEDPGRRIETYIGPKSFTKILALVMACAAAILVLMGILSSSGSEKIITEVFDPLDSETGKDAYLDVVGISDWLVELDSNTWYAAVRLPVHRQRERQSVQENGSAAGILESGGRQRAHA